MFDICPNESKKKRKSISKSKRINFDTFFDYLKNRGMNLNFLKYFYLFIYFLFFLAMIKSLY
jgi:hypothetical protein